MGDSWNDPTLILYSFYDVCIMGINYLDIMKKQIKDIIGPYLGYNEETGEHDIINNLPLEIFNQIIVNVVQEFTPFNMD